ncbi:MAG: hypothetical protein R3D71_09230 [Rickettsiales bacterium]
MSLDKELYLPKAKVGNNSFISVFSHNYIHYYVIGSPIIQSPANMANVGAIAVRHAYSIDNKLDDGLPMSGRVSVRGTTRLSVSIPPMYTIWYNNSSGTGSYIGNQLVPVTNATAASDTTCWDNNNSAGETQRYSIAQNGGNGTNCAISIKF